jgi:hypothetical protein
MSPFSRCLTGVSLFLMASCSKTETYPTVTLGTYYPLSVGKYIIYRMDSLVFVNSGETMQTNSYLAKDTIDGTLLDNTGQTMYRVHRFLTDTLESQPWQDDITYTVTPTTNTVELVENNLRFIKLTEPFSLGEIWDGNAYLGDYPYQSFYGAFPSQSGIQSWEYSYENIGQPYNTGSVNFSNTITVQEANDSTNLPLPNDSVYASKSYGLEVYASGIGLIYKSYIQWDFQPATSNLPGFYEGFGVTERIVAHN